MTALLLCMALPSHAQFMDLNLEIESEMSAGSMKPLNFGLHTPNSGRSSVESGSNRMGVLNIKTLKNQWLLISVDRPGSLYLNGSEKTVSIPISLETHYGYTTGQMESSRQLGAGNNEVIIASDDERSPWVNMYIFIFGSVEIGNVATGIYSNSMVLNITYI